MHIGRNLYYGSYKSPRVLPYAVGVIILVLMIATAFLGWIYGPKCYILIIKSHITLFLNSIIFFKTLSSKSLIINYFYLRLKKFFFKFKLSVAPTPLVLGVKPPRRIKSSKLDVISEWTSNRDR